MHGAQLKSAVIEELSNLAVHHVNTTGIQHTVRCPYCGDSRKANHGHFSIKIDETDEYSPMVFRCFKCSASGLLTKDVINDLGLNISSEISGELQRFNQKSAKYNKFTDSRSEQFDIINPFSRKAESKLDYVNERLNTDFTFDDAKCLKFVLDLEEFVVSNKIRTITGITPNQLRFYDNHYVGFLSSNNNCLTLRAIDDVASMRYIKIILNNRNLDPHTFYAIPNTIDMLYTHDINVHITEGIFDILGVYNLHNRNKENNYYYAVCGYGYNTILRSLIRLGFNTGLNVHIYADNDKTDRDIIYHLTNNKSVYPWLDNVWIHRNSFNGQKDFGVPLTSIIDSHKKIK